MPNRFSLRTRPIFDEGEQTWGESASRGIEKGISTYLQMKQQGMEEENQIAMQHGTIDPRGGVKPVYSQTPPDVRPIRSINPTSPGGGVPGGPLPSQSIGVSGALNHPAMQMPNADRDYGYAGQYPNGDATTRSIGRAPMDEKMPNVARGGGVADELQGQGTPMITVRLPSGRTAHIPDPAYEAAMQKRSEFQFEKGYEHRNKMEELKATPHNPEYDIPFAERYKMEQAGREKVAGMTGDRTTEMIAGMDRRNAATIAAENARSANTIAAADRRAKDGAGGANSVTSQGHQLVASGTAMIKAGTDQDGNVTDQTLVDQGKAAMKRGSAMIAREPGGGEEFDPGMQERRRNATPGTIQLRQRKIAFDLQQRYPHATEAQIKDQTRKVMVKEGWPIK